MSYKYPYINAAELLFHCLLHQKNTSTCQDILKDLHPCKNISNRPGKFIDLCNDMGVDYVDY